MSITKTTNIRRLLSTMYWRRDCPQAFKYLEILRRAEFEDSRLIEMRQWESLQKILKHAGQNVPYYRDLFKNMGIRPEDIRTPGDLERIPLLTKDLLQQHTSQLLQTAGEEGNRLPNASGGSTGKPVRFYQDTFYWTFARASQWFAEGWWGIQPGDRIASIWGCDRDLPDMTWKERLRLKIEQTRLCNAFAMSEESMEKFAQMMVRWKPRYVTGYASALEVFANFLLSRPDLVVRPHAVKSTAEALFSAQRVAIEKAFEAPLYNFYGSREVNNLAAECQAHEGLHINSLGRYIEIVDELGKAQPPGKPGRIVVTDLTNFAMPFIRYAIEDVGSWRGKPCSCGRPFPLLERVWGRSSDFIVAPGGKLIHGEFFTHLFYNIPGIDQFRVVQRTKSEVRVDIVMQPGVSSVQTDLLRSRIADVMGPNVNCEIQVVTSIERPASGKHRFTISEVPVPWKETSLENLEEAGPIQI